jgi:predicted RecA/RadA family phage recombinase
MKNFINEGYTLDVTSGSNVTSGQLVILGSLVGVATTTAAAGTTFALKTSGVFELAKNSAEAWTIGAKIYWDTTNLWATTTVGSNVLIGRAAEIAANPSAVGRVLLARTIP